MIVNEANDIHEYNNEIHKLIAIWVNRAFG